MNIGQISKLSDLELKTVGPGTTVHDAIKELCRHNIGALPVCEADGKLVGIITERDVLRLAARDNCAETLHLEVREVMTTNLVVCFPDDSIDYAMRVMTERRIRHLPVLDGQQLIGILSIGDVVKTKQEQADTEIRFMRDYLSS